MSDPVYDVRFPEGQPQPEQRQRRVNLREVISVAFLLVGVTMMSVGVGGYLDSLWAGVAVAGTVLTVLGLLLGNN
mgnify:CR=1 FL=1